MYIAVSTDCFPEIPMPDVVETFIDLEFTTIEIALRENGGVLSPSRIEGEMEQVIRIVRDSHRLDLCSFDVYIEATGEEYYAQFSSICTLAKATKVVTLTIPSAELGTPLRNEEVRTTTRVGPHRRIPRRARSHEEPNRSAERRSRYREGSLR